jgi:predicted AlkP superfamily pyrophosphatase or phosphodiesterase
MCDRRYGKFFAVLLLASGVRGLPSSQQPEPTPRPKIVVLIAVDQLVPEQLDRLAPWFEGGFARLLGEGRFYVNAALEYANTETGPGHATLATGCDPCTHGIVGNEYYDRATLRSAYCVGDESVKDLRTPESRGMSPRNLRVPALGDHLRASDPKALVVSVAGKDRSAVLMGGQHPDWAFWWDFQGGGFTSSTWYGEHFPDWIEHFNQGWRARASGWVWEELHPDGLPGSGTAVDDRAGEGGPKHVFPYTFSALPEDADPRRVAQLAGGIFFSPLIDSFVVDAALESIHALDLGADDHTDLLCLGFSACDAVGHVYGPTSREVSDLLLRLDRELGRLFDRLDEVAGEGCWMACLSADHGVLELPETLRDQDIGAVRLPMSDLGALVKAISTRLEEDFHADLGARWADGIVLDGAAAEAAGISIEAARRAASEAARSLDWVARAYTFEDLADGCSSEDPWLRLAARCFSPDRSPDLVIQLPPWHVLAVPSGTTHGSPYPYDRRIPLVFYGPGISAGRSYERASSTDAVPTLLDRLGIAVPAGLDGVVLDLR